jgi:hypothetical protein
MASKVQLSDEIERELNDLIKYMTDKGVENVSQEQVLSSLIEHGLECKDAIVAKFLKEPDAGNWESDPIFGFEVCMGADASESVDKDIYGE